MSDLCKILAIAQKELLVLMGSTKSRFMVLIPPIIQLFVFAFAATMEVKNVDVLILNHDSGRWSQELYTRLQGSNTFRNVLFAPSQNSILNDINSQQILLAIVINNDFSKNIESQKTAQIQIILDARKSNTAQIVTQYIETIAQEMTASLPQSLNQSPPPPQIQILSRNWFNPNLDFQWFILPNLIGTINFIMGILITGLTVARERELGTFDQMLVSPAHPMEIAFGKLIPGCLIGLIHGSIFFAAAILYFNVPFVGSVMLLYISMFLFSLAVCSLGLMVSSFAATQQQAFLGCFTIAVPCILLSGFITPINNMPIFLQQLSEINPLRHFIVILQGLFLKDISLAAAFDCCARIAVIAAISATLAIWMFQRKA